MILKCTFLCSLKLANDCLQALHTKGIRFSVLYMASKTVTVININITFTSDQPAPHLNQSLSNSHLSTNRLTDDSIHLRNLSA